VTPGSAKAGPSLRNSIVIQQTSRPSRTKLISMKRKKISKRRLASASLFWRFSRLSLLNAPVGGA